MSAVAKALSEESRPASTVDVKVGACTAPSVLASLIPHPELDSFRPAAKQLEALVEIAQAGAAVKASSSPRSCVATAIAANAKAGVASDAATAPTGVGARLVGYAAFHPPSAIEPWGEDRSGALIELGAVEVASGHRGLRLAERLLAAGFADGRYDDTVVFATLYRWHYDLERTGLGELGYRRMLERLYSSAGFVPLPTTDPEVSAHGANRLMARIGPRAPSAVVAEFHRLRQATGRRW